MTLVFVDLDGTLLAGRGSERRFLLHLLRHGHLGAAQLAAAAGFLLGRWPRLGATAIKRNKACLAGLAEAEVRALGAAFARTALIGHLRPSLLERLARHRDDGERLVLLTGSLDYLAAPIAAEIDAACCATLCCVRAGRLTAAPPLRHPFGREKLRLARTLAAQARTTLADCAAYGDSGHDLALLGGVGRPVAVHPDRRLARHARRAGWEILDDTRPPAGGGSKGWPLPAAPRCG